MNATKKSLILFAVLILSTLACGLENIQVVESPDLEATITAQALILEQGGQPPVENPVQEQVVVVVTATPEAGAASTEQVQPAQVLPPATGAVTVTVTTATNCRSGPGQNFKIIYGMPIGQVAKVVAKNSYSGYWVIEIPGQAGQTCWLWGQYAVINGDTSTLKEVVTPTSPAPTITNTPKPTNTLAPTATNTTAPALAPNAPQILTSNVVCTDAGGGNRSYAVQISWADNSNNETAFWINASPSGSFYGVSANVTSTTFTEVLPAGTTLTINLTAQNGTGSSAASSAAFVCP
jgi:hypothetical protein